jgi:nitroreductase
MAAPVETQRFTTRMTDETFSMTPPDWAVLAGELMATRQTVLPKRLVAPGPDEWQQRQLLAAAATAPDHRQLRPWRFVRIPLEGRAALAELFAAALLERDPQATPTQQAQARDKAFRAPHLLLMVVDATKGDAQVPVLERTLSAGCAVQNLLLMATAQGFGSALTSGKALQSPVLRHGLGLAPNEHALCFVSIGTAQKSKNPPMRPDPDTLVSTWVGALVP